MYLGKVIIKFRMIIICKFAEWNAAANIFWLIISSRNYPEIISF